MKNTLQYAYSIGVFLGVLLTAYLMMNQDGSARLPNRTFSSNGGLKTEAHVLDPAVSQLLEMERALTKRQKDESEKSVGEKSPPNTGKIR